MQRQSTTSPLLSLPGAVAAEGQDEGVAAHYGDLFPEQRALADGKGLVDLSHRGVGNHTPGVPASRRQMRDHPHRRARPRGEATPAQI
ncbi:folate-binding protein, partial [Streptomyces niveus]